MSEIKGQLLGLLAVLLVFGAVGATVASTVKKDGTTISSKASEVESQAHERQSREYLTSAERGASRTSFCCEKTAVTFIIGGEDKHMATEKLEEIKKLFAEKLGMKTVDETKSLKELGLDSLDVVELSFDLEDRYGITLEPEKLSAIKTVADLYSVIESHL